MLAEAPRKIERPTEDVRDSVSGKRVSQELVKILNRGRSAVLRTLQVTARPAPSTKNPLFYGMLHADFPPIARYMASLVPASAVFLFSSFLSATLN